MRLRWRTLSLGGITNTNGTFARLAGVCFSCHRVLRKLEESFMSALIAMATKPMHWFAAAHRFFRHVSDNARPDFLKFIALLFCFPCFKAHDFFFKIVFLLKQRRILRLQLKRSILRRDNRVFKGNQNVLMVSKGFQLHERFYDVFRGVEALKSSRNFHHNPEICSYGISRTHRINC